MGLQDSADGKIGNWQLRGISGGEKRRLSISVEILTQPQVLFLDEPTSGLDSASALFVIQVPRNIAHDGKIVACFIHHPSSDVFTLFDDLYILSGGETVYFGEAQKAVKVRINSIKRLLTEFRRERFGGHYGEAVYVLSNFLSSLPFVAAISISSGTILYYMVNFHRGFSQYWYLSINLFCRIAIKETFTLIVSTMVPNLLMSIGASAGLVGQYKNDMIGLEFDPPVPRERS
ncbi:hypothetical protein CRYUN_Cryun08bG0093500 [Craigia yunnanensis]